MWRRFGHGGAPVTTVIEAHFLGQAQRVSGHLPSRCAVRAGGRFENFREVNAQEVWSSDLEEKYNPEFYFYKTYDMVGK